MKDYNYELNVDSALLKENLSFEQILTFDKLQPDQYQTFSYAEHEHEYASASLFLKDKSTINRIVKVFLDKYKEKIHVTYISTPDSMVVKLSH